MTPRQRSSARRMRKNPSAAEAILWRALRDKKLLNLRFRRQAIIGPYIVDIACMSRRLVIEADGPFHDAEKDAIRGRWLQSQGFRVLRFRSLDVINNPGIVIEAVNRIAAPSYDFDPKNDGFGDG